MLWWPKRGVKYNIYIYLILYNLSSPPYTFTKNLHLHLHLQKKELNNTTLAAPRKIIDKFKKNLYTPPGARQGKNYGMA